MRVVQLIIILISCSAFIGCNGKSDKVINKERVQETVQKALDTTELLRKLPEGMEVPKGMVWIPGGVCAQGAVSQDTIAMGYEKPRHKVGVDGFFMDVTEVTNSQYSKFVDDTG